jgi:hypothetical protein
LGDPFGGAILGQVDRQELDIGAEALAQPA